MISKEMFNNLATIHSRYHTEATLEVLQAAPLELNSSRLEYSGASSYSHQSQKEAREHRSPQFLCQGYEMLYSVVSSTDGFSARSQIAEEEV